MTMKKIRTPQFLVPLTERWFDLRDEKGLESKEFLNLYDSYIGLFALKLNMSHYMGAPGEPALFEGVVEDKGTLYLNGHAVATKTGQEWTLRHEDVDDVFNNVSGTINLTTYAEKMYLCL